MKLLGYLIAPVAVMALALGGSTAHSASIVQTDTIGQTPTDWGPTIFTPAFNQFNPASGTLTSVVVAISATGAMSGTVTNNSNTPQSFTVTETSTLSVGAFPDSALSTFSPVLTGTQSYVALASLGSAPFGPFSPSDNSQGQTFTAPADLAGFTGLGTFSVTALTSTANVFSGGGGNETGVFATTAGVSVTVTYNYSTTAPEPASFVLAGLGAVGLVLAARRRRKA